jgi:zinc protease
MNILASRPLRIFVASLVSLGLIGAAPAPTPVAPLAPPAIPWLYKNSDIPVDTAWKFGELSNGLRYGVRNNGVPPGQVSIRIAIDAGSMMERENELGFAHFNEHLSFRGSKYVTDGEAKRVWQRLGASFGSDTNAVTSSTQTVYKLDLPSATEAGLDETFKILSGMMEAPNMGQTEVDAERRTVLAELRESDGPDVRVGNALRGLIFGGQPLGTRPTIGTIPQLNAATPAGLRAFRDRWYRPEKAVISISGDVAPAKMEALIGKYFGDWKGVGPATAEVDFGAPQESSPKVLFMSEPGATTVVTMAYVRPWKPKFDTIALNQGRLLDMVATAIINRRLEERARGGASYIGAGVDRSEVSRSVDVTFVSVVPIGNDWLSALTDVRAALELARTTPPTQAEIDREVAEVVAAFDVQVENAEVVPSSKQADDLVEAVNIRETVASPQAARDIFTALKSKITPSDILKSSQSLFEGVGPRVFVSSKVPMADGQQKLAAAIAAPVKAMASSQSKGPVTFDQLPKFGAPATIIAEGRIAGLDTKTLELSNGVKVLMSASPYESGRIFVQARFGKGRQAFPKTRITPAWAAAGALMSSGIGTLTQNDLDKLTTGRKMSLEFEIGDDAFTLRGNTRPADLNDQLKLLAAKLGAPGWDPAPLNRAKAGYLLDAATLDSSPQGVINRDLQLVLHGNDKRWASPTAAEAEALTPAVFRAFWQPLLTTGEIELSVFGDIDMAKTIEMVKSTFGSLPKRKPALMMAKGNVSSGPIPNSTPLVRTHRGNPEQAAAVLAWNTGGGIANSFESRVLDVLAEVFTDRMFEQFREAEGASYSPVVFSSWPMGMESGGSFVVLSQIKPDGVDRFYTRSKAIAADLIAKPVTDDELKRALGPMRENLSRATSGKWFWMTQLAGSSSDPRRIAVLRSWPSDLEKITAADVQAAAAKYLLPGKGFSFVVLPAKKKAKAA